MATGATLHLEGMRCGSPVPGLPVLPESHCSGLETGSGAAGDATPQFVTLSLGKEATMAWEKSSFWSIAVSHSTIWQVLWHRQVSSTSVNTKHL